MDPYENIQGVSPTLGQQALMVDENEFTSGGEETERNVVLVETRSMGYPASWVIVDNSDEVSG